MQRVVLDSETPEVKQFISNLPIVQEGVELELDGRVICKVVPTAALSEPEKRALVRKRWELIRRAQERSKGVPAKVIEQEIRESVEEVRRRKRR